MAEFPPRRPRSKEASVSVYALDKSVYPPLL
jgi:hypothetical protein